MTSWIKTAKIEALKKHAHLVCFCFTSDGKIVFADSRGNIYIRNHDQNQLCLNIGTPPTHMLYIANTSFVVIASGQNQLKIIDIDLNSLLSCSITGHADSISNITHNRTSNYLITTCKNKSFLWEVPSLTEIDVSQAWCVFLPCYDRILTIRNSHPLRLQLFNTCFSLPKFEAVLVESQSLQDFSMAADQLGGDGPLMHFCVAKNGRLAAGFNRYNKVFIWKLPELVLLYTFNIPEGNGIQTLYFSHHTTDIFVLTRDGNVRIIDISSGEEIGWVIYEKQPQDYKNLSIGPEDQVASLNISGEIHVYQSRFLCWQKILRIPKNIGAFHQLQKFVESKNESLFAGSMTFFSDDDQLSTEEQKCLRTVCSCLGVLAPKLFQVPVLQCLIMPFVCVCQSDPFPCLEMSLTFLNNWCHGWFDNDPTPLDQLLLLLRKINPPLYFHLQRKNLSAKESLWDFMTSLGVNVFSQQPFFSLWDKLLIQGPEFYVYFCVAFIVYFSDVFFQVSSAHTLKAIFFVEQDKDMNAIYNLAESLFGGRVSRGVNPLGKEYRIRIDKLHGRKINCKVDHRENDDLLMPSFNEKLSKLENLLDARMRTVRNEWDESVKEATRQQKSLIFSTLNILNERFEDALSKAEKEKDEEKERERERGSGKEPDSSRPEHNQTLNEYERLQQQLRREEHRLEQLQKSYDFLKNDLNSFVKHRDTDHTDDLGSFAKAKNHRLEVLKNLRTSMTDFSEKLAKSGHQHTLSEINRSGASGNKSAKSFLEESRNPITLSDTKLESEFHQLRQIFVEYQVILESEKSKALDFLFQKYNL